MVQRESSVMTPCAISYFTVYKPTIQELVGNNVAAESRPGDIFHPDFLQGRPAYFALSVRNSLQKSFIVSSAITAGSAAAAGEMEKDL